MPFHPTNAHHAHSQSFGGALHNTFPSLPSDALGPPVRPLDFAAVMQSQDALHNELARTVDELAQWLSVVEVGFTQMLDAGGEATIEEEEHEQDDNTVSLPMPMPHGGQTNGVVHEPYREEVVNP